jgi:hypothetical protein
MASYLLRSLISGSLALSVLFSGKTRAAAPFNYSDTASPFIQIVYSSDAHFAISRHQFQGDSDVDALIVNTRLIARINALPAVSLPDDQGVNAGQTVGAIDYFMESGDVASRQETPNQNATASWTQFTQIYLQGLKLHDHHGNPTPFLLMPGNHDVSNAIGFYKKMQPATDPSSMIGIYNLMLQPVVPKTTATYHYPADKINYSKDIGGIHFMFINIWPDSANRIWMEKDLQKISSGTPVIIVCHDPPDGDAAHFNNPNGNHSINATDKFENLLEERSKDLQDNPRNHDAKPTNDDIEQAGFVAFLKAHANIKAYFHGHNNWNQFYTYKGPNKDISLPTFRVDSPMKGRISSKDETKLSFQLITIDTATKKMTVRECLWNTDPSHPDKTVSWGESETIFL